MRADAGPGGRQAARCAPVSRGLIAAALLLLPAPAVAGEADVLAARAVREAGGTWRFEATLRHADTGWEHYADRWEVLAPDGTVLATRTLYHPHVDEQPFTRSLGGIELPANVGRVRVRAHDSEHGYGGREATLDLPR